MAQHHLHHEASLLIKMLNSYLYFVFKLIINSERIGIDYSLKKKKQQQYFYVTEQNKWEEWIIIKVIFNLRWKISIFNILILFPIIYNFCDLT